ncbi:MAG: 4-hydroxy-3-methylbut-2-enyl diphosphate reductase, partial [Clostridiales bacterium]|nr:4-hydroxy-3-methylbut-2-enyl diphosphate reductase [Clostridiales bacterium]
MILAKHAGFCFGVRRAVETARRSAPAVTLGPVIHNPRVVSELEAAGVKSVASPEEIPEGARVVVRSHGVGRETLDALKARNVEILDATCPFVRRIHEISLSAERNGIALIVVGEERHPEVEGIRGWTSGESYAVATEEAALALPGMESALVVSQTTFIEERFDRITEAIAKRVKHPEIIRTICPATKESQEEAVRLAREVDCMIVVGGRESSNSRKLYELVREVLTRSHFIESAEELGGIALDAVDRVGITAGASTPDCIIKEVVARMNDIEKQVTPSEEHVEQAETS